MGNQIETVSVVALGLSPWAARVDGLVCAFLEAGCEFAPAHEVRAAVCYAAYLRHAQAAHVYVLTATAFGRGLAVRGFGVVKRGGFKYRLGLRLRGGAQ